MGDMMEKIEQKYEAAQQSQRAAAAAKQAAPSPPLPSASLLPEAGKPLEKYAGFFSA